MPRNVKKNVARAARSPRRGDLIAAAQAAEWEGNLPTVRAAAREYARYVARNNVTRYVSADGLAALIERGVQHFVEGGGKNHFPHNLGDGQGRLALIGAVSRRQGLRRSNWALEIGRKGRKLPREEANSLISEAARLGGWFAAATKLPALRRALERGLSARGLNSFRTSFSPAHLAAKFPSPGNLSRRLLATRRKAEAILTGYAGEKPSWASLVLALMADGRPGKAGLIAAALTLGWDGGEGHDWSEGSRYWGLRAWANGYGTPAQAAYSQARAWLVSVRLAGRILDTTDGVEMWLDLEPAYTKAGFSVTRGVIRGEWGRRQLGWLVRSPSGETYHLEAGTARKAEQALRFAVANWRRQRQYAKEEADLLGFLQGETGVCPLVFRRDSAAAGNCRSGTEAWLRKWGWAGREWIPAAWLLPHLEEPRVRRVAEFLHRERYPVGAFSVEELFR